MNSKAIRAISATALLASGLILAHTKPAVDLEGAIAKEQVSGDLKAAISADQKIAAEGSAARNVRAKALLHLAGCYEKLGQQQSRAVYEQIVRDFADQPAALQARARLIVLKTDERSNTPPATMTQRKIETTSRYILPTNTDGRRVVYLNDETGELIYGDLAGNHKRVIFKAKLDDIPEYLASKDLSLVALHFWAKPSRPSLLAVIRTDGTGYREVLRDGETRSEVGDLSLDNWSWDNRFWLVESERKNAAARVLVISVADGSIRELVSLKSGDHFANSSFSPDGRFVAYRSYPEQAGGVATHISVIAFMGGKSRLLDEEPPIEGPSNMFLDWTADGRYLVTLSHRPGRTALYLLPVKAGMSAGAPIFVRYATIGQGSTTRAGSVILQSLKPGGLWAVHLASLDANGRVGPWQKLDFRGGNVMGFPIGWSPDGNQLVYAAESEEQIRGTIVTLRNLASGEDRELYHGVGSVSCRFWVARPSTLLCQEPKNQTDKEIFTIGVNSGQIEPIHTFSSTQLYLGGASRDGRALYFRDFSESGYETQFRWEIATSQEAERERFPYPEDNLGVHRSQDDRWLLRVSGRNVEIRPVAGGDWRSVVSISNTVTNCCYWGVDFTPDGNWLIYLDKDSGGKLALFRVSTNGGTPEFIGVYPSNERMYADVSISPDGRKIIARSREIRTAFEMWSLENFVPPAAKKKE